MIKKYSIFKSLIILSTVVNAQKQHHKGYVTIDYDNFDGTRLQHEKYTHNPFWVCGWDSACFDLNPENYIVKDGILELNALYTPNIKCPLRSCGDTVITKNYTCQQIASTRNYKYGRFTMRAYVPAASGLLPAYWLYGGSERKKYDHTEIDIFEFWGINLVIGKDTVNFKSHIHLWNGRKDINGGHKWAYIPLNMWHTYTLDWKPDYLKVFVDDSCVYSISKNLRLGNMRLVIGNQIHGKGTGPIIPELFPLTMKIDFLKIEYPIDTTEIVYLNNFASLYSENTVFSGKEIYVSPDNGKVIIEPNIENKTIELLATDKINFKPGFHAKYQSKFIARLVKINEISFNNPEKHNLDSLNTK